MFRILLSLLFIVSVLIDVQAQRGKDSLSSQIEVDGKVVATLPTFRGGTDAEFLKYINSRIVYPKEAIRKRIEGNIFIEFIIEKNGSLSNIKAYHFSDRPDPDPLLLEAALKAFENCPKWEPGTNNGVPVPVRKVIPVKFKL